VRCYSFAESGLAGSGDGAESVDEIVRVRGDVKGEPGELGWADVDAGVHGEEVGLCVLVVLERFLRSFISLPIYRINADVELTNP